MFCFFFHMNITSSDLNEFWIGQKFWKALDLLFRLSTTFMGVFRKYLVAKWGRFVKKKCTQISRRVRICRYSGPSLADPLLINHLTPKPNTNWVINQRFS